MRSATVLFQKPRGAGTRRSTASTRASARREPLPFERRRRYPGVRLSAAECAARPEMPARPRLSRVRPLRVIPRGVIPYVKH